jgi:opacity protein-like surface antigen
MKKLALLPIGAALIWGVGTAQAQQPPITKNVGWYLQGNFQAAFPEDRHFGQGAINGELKYDTPGWGGGGAFGYKFGDSMFNGVRAEFEINYAQYPFNKITANNATASIDGKNRVWSFTGNGYYDFRNLGLWRGISPYVGGGLGLAHIERGSVGATAGTTTVNLPGNTRDKLTVVAEGGINIPLTANMELVPAYRFQWIDNGDGTLDEDKIHQARLGLRYTF